MLGHQRKNVWSPRVASATHLKNTAWTSFPQPLEPSTTFVAVITIGLLRHLSPFFHCDFLFDRRVHRHIEYFVHATHFLAAALNIGRTHLLCDFLALFLGYWCKTLRFEEIDAGAFGTEVGFEAYKDKGSCGTEVEHFWIPLQNLVSTLLPQSQL